MATYVSLVNFTDQGIRNIKESPGRFETFKAMAEKSGVTIKCAYYTAGAFDLVLISEGSDEAAMSALLQAGSLGNIRTQTLRGFSVDEMRKIIGSLPAS